MKISLFYEHVTVLDYAFLDDHKGLVGNSLVVNVEFIGKTDEEGILYDFSYAKKKVKEIIDRDCDHRLVVPKSIVSFEAGRAKMEYTYGLEDAKLQYWAPEQAICEIPYSSVTYANLQSFLEEKILIEMPENVLAIRLEFVEEDRPDHTCYFHYTHGLKDHYGNCQRLFHGHRNTVKIEVNGERDQQLEMQFANEEFSGNIHFAFWENIENKDEIVQITGQENPEGRFPDLPSVHLKYDGNQGEFEAIIPGSQIYLMQTESTVENLSIHFAKKAKSMLDANDRVVATAYEGIAKGAITSL